MIIKAILISIVILICLQRKEHTKRNDYNLRKRRKIQERAFGWTHVQDNYKMIKNTNNGKNVLLAQKKEIDPYTKVEDSKYILAQNWWKKISVRWGKARSKWEKVYSYNKELSLKTKVNNKSIFSVLIDLKPTANRAEFDAIIDSL